MLGCSNWDQNLWPTAPWALGVFEALSTFAFHQGKVSLGIPQSEFRDKGFEISLLMLRVTRCQEGLQFKEGVRKAKVSRVPTSSAHERLVVSQGFSQSDGHH